MMEKISGPQENKIGGSKLLDSSLSFGHMSKLSPEKGWMKE